jgi:hypothetical protein
LSDVDWIDLAQDLASWWLLASRKGQEFFGKKRVVTSEEGLCLTELLWYVGPLWCSVALKWRVSKFFCDGSGNHTIIV